MRSGIFRFAILVLCLTVALLVSSTFAQNIVTGGISGTVTDPSNAVVPNATLSLKSNSTGESQQTTSSSTGLYNFPLLKPGSYSVTIAQSGFRGVSQKVDVLLGQVTTVNIKLAVGNASETVEVTGTAPLLQTEDANISTTFTPNQIENLPTPGGDITSYAQTAPGVLMNTQAGAGWGNFSAFGLPATSNLFTLNGNDENDPFLNLNNSGSSNLLLGQNEVQEIAVVSNGYTAQYGRQAGVQVDYSTKSGTNTFHGNANYWFNSSGFNANEWFLKSNEIGSGAPNQQPFAVNNQWAASIGGPIVKDKLFFYVDQEGLRYALPTTSRIFIPTPAFSSYILGNIGSNQPAQLPYYTQLMNLYKGSPLYGAALASPGAVAAFDPATFGCGDFAGTAGFGTAATPCLMTTQGSGVNHNKEWLLTTRIDYNISSSDKLFGRFKTDHGSQPTSTDLIDPAVFSSHSIQPQYEGQLNETHVFSPNMVNNFILGGLWYSAYFVPDSGQAAVISTLGMSTIQFLGNNLLSPLGGPTNAPDYFWPQGRNSTMAQVTDDLSITKGAHTFKMGLAFRRDDLSDYDAQETSGGLMTFTSLADFVNGTPLTPSDGYTQVFSSAPKAPLAFYNLGLYFQDEWKVNSNLKLTLALRGDRNSNPVCQSNCFARLEAPFSLSSHNADTPYNQLILANQHSAFAGIEKVALQPRFGFTYSPKGLTNTVFRGGIGVFSDLYQGILLDSLLLNSPTTNIFNVFPGAFGSPNPLAPSAPNSVTSTAAANNASFLSGFASGGTLASIQAANPGFLPPNMFSVANQINNPKYLEWNFEIQQAFGSKMSVNLNYVGTHGYNTLMQNPGLNAYLSAGSQPFGQLPFTAPDPRLGAVSEISSIGRSNYDGLTATFTRRMSYGFQVNANYTFSHSLDDLTSTNPGTPYSLFNSVLRQVDPFQFDNLTYGNADSDSRHNFTANYVWNMPHRFQNRLTELALGGWGVAGTFFAHSGVPFTALTTETQILNLYPFGGPIAQFFGGPNGAGCDNPGSNYAVAPNQCLQASQFAPPGDGGQNVWGNVARNSFRSPHYFDTDFSVLKNFAVTERVRVQLGANFFNILNHPNFFTPFENVASPIFGQLFATASQPTTPYGAFSGAGVTGRLIQMQAKLIF